MAIPKIKLTKCDQDKVRATLTGLGLPTDGTPKATVTRLATYYDDNQTKLDIAGCDVCNADSDATLDACPFCGTEGEVDESKAAPAEATQGTLPGHDDEPPPPTKKAKAAAKKAKAAQAKADKLNASGKGTETADAMASATKTPATKKAAAKGKDKPAKPAAKKAPAKKAAAKGKPAKAAEPKPDEATAIVVTVKDLDAQVQVIRQQVSDGAIALHRLGVAAKAISDNGLWKMREAKGGVPAYRNFKQFCAEDLGMTSVHIYRAMGVAEKFTEDEIKGLSGAQVRVVMQLPADARQDALDAAKGGASTSALTERANALRGNDGTAPTPSKAVTVAMTMGMQKVQLFKRPTKRGAKVGDTENATPAKSLADKPWLMVELTNKVRMLVRLDTNKAGELTGTVEFRRGEQAL